MSRKADIATLALLLLSILLFFSDVLFLGKAFYIRDVARIYYPERKVLRDILLSGQFPFWNPHYAGGQPLAANPTGEVFYPPQWLVLLPDFQLGVALEIVIHFLIGAAGMFVLLRSLRLARTAATFGAFTFALSGLLLSLASLLPEFFAIVWLPWLAFALQRFVERRRFADFALAALFLGIILLIGEPSTILQSGALASAWLIFRLRNARGVALAVALCALALIVGSAQIIPAIDHKRDSGLAGGLSYLEVSQQSMRPARPLELIAPNLFGRFTTDAIYFWGSEEPVKVPWMLSWYCGLLAGALMIAGFICGTRGCRFAGAVAIVSYLFALGRYGPLFPLLYRAGFRFIRYPEKWFMGASFLLIVFAAIAANQFLEEAQFRRITFFVALALVGVEACVFAFVRSPLFPTAFHLAGYLEDILREARSGALTTLATSIALVLILLFRDRPRVCLPLLAVFVIADLGTRVVPLTPRIDRRFYDPPPIARSLPAGARLYNDADWRLKLLPQPHVGDRERWARLRNAMLPEIQSLWGFDSVLEPDVTETMLLPTIELNQLFWRAQFAGRNDIVRQILAAAGATHVIALRDAASPSNPVSVVPLPGNRRWKIEGPGRIVSARQTANTIDFEVDATGNALLVVSVTRHRYWQARVDGAPATIRPANVAFQAVVVPRGRHHLAFRYRNPLVVIFGFVSAISFAALLAAYFVAEHRSRRGHIE